MATLVVPRIDLGPQPEIEMVSAALDSLPKNEIACVNWPEQFPDRPRVRFAIAHSGAEIYIKYWVEEDAVRAVYESDGNRPWEESCVEFFVSPRAGSEAYCNLEMSCIGYGILHGAAEDAVGLVRRLPSMERTAFGVREGRTEWTLTVAIPVEALGRGPIEAGERLRANFYKCGDLLPRPHYLSWSPIDTPQPSFHQPGQFGELVFE